MKTFPAFLALASLASLACLGLTGCGTTHQTGQTGGRKSGREDSAPAPLVISPSLRRQILAMDPAHVSEREVREILSRAPAPRIFKVHGGVYPVQYFMKDFSQFLIAMGYPKDRVRQPGGNYSFSCYDPAEVIAGAMAWSYEQEKLPVIAVGHSQGGMQIVKALHLLEGSIRESPPRVWNLIERKPENRTAILDPRKGGMVATNKIVPVIHASVVGAGGAASLLPNQWEIAGQIRKVPDSTQYFTGYFIPGDVIGGGLESPESGNRYRPTGKAQVRNVVLSRYSRHFNVPETLHLARDAASREWIASYHPSQGQKLPEGYSGPTMNIFWAAEVWYEMKKHWCMALQQHIRAR